MQQTALPNPVVYLGPSMCSGKNSSSWEKRMMEGFPSVSSNYFQSNYVAQKKELLLVLWEKGDKKKEVKCDSSLGYQPCQCSRERRAQWWWTKFTLGQELVRWEIPTRLRVSWEVSWNREKRRGLAKQRTISFFSWFSPCNSCFAL